MRHSALPLLKRWLFFWDVVLAVCAGIAVFALFDVLTGGFLISTAMMAVALTVAGFVHFLAWGRAFERAERGSAASPAPSRPASPAETPPDLFTVEMTDPERAELIRVLESALAATPSTGGASIPQACERAAILRELLDRLRMFGA